MNQSGHYSTQQAQSKRTRSPSVSASSVVTVKRAPSPAISHRLDSQPPARAQGFSHLPLDDSSLSIQIPTSRIARSPSPAAVSQVPESQINDGVGNLNRWSQSTASSPALDSPRRERRGSGAETPSIWNRRKPSISQPRSPYREELSPRSTVKPREGSPMKVHDQHRRNIPSFDKPLPQAMPTSSLAIPNTSVASPNGSDIMLTATSFTPSSAGLLTPRSYTGNDYFGASATVAGASKREGPPSVRQHQSPGRGSHDSTRRPSHHQHHPSSSIEDMSPYDSSQKRPRPKDRREKDKKTMLSKALEKANTAVLLDNAMNYEGALDAYQDACRLLDFVMDRTHGVDDRRKLEAIRETYAIRVEELLQLQATSHSPVEQKRLPPRPTSNESIDFNPNVNIDTAFAGDRDSAVIETATLTRIVDAPRNPSFMPRHSFLSDAIREVEGGSSSEAFLGPLWEKTKAPLRASTLSDRTARGPEAYEDTYMPRPLTPRRSPSRASQDSHLEEDHGTFGHEVDSHDEHAGEIGGGAEPTDSVSWLDTIDESGSDTTSMHSRSLQHDLHRRDLSGPLAEADLDFDAAFDAAVEAAYEDGYVPDHDAARPATMDSQVSGAHGSQTSGPAPIQGFDFPSDTEEDMDEAAEEERMLDDITRDYIAGHGFDFDMQSKSALPRQSDSSLMSRDTWQSSVVSNRTTAGTSLSTGDRGLMSDGKVDDNSSAPPHAEAHQGVPPDFIFTHPSARPLSIISEGARSVQDRRSTGPNFKQLKIETTRKPDQWARTSLLPVNTDNANGDEHAEKDDRPISEVPSLHQFEKKVLSPGAGLPSAGSDHTDGNLLDSSAPPSAGTIGSMKSPRPRLFRKNKSTLSLRDQSMLISEESEPVSATPMSASFFPGTHEPFAARRPHITPSAGSYSLQNGAYTTAQLFDTSVGAEASRPSSSQSENSMYPPQIEACPESALLRPFWLLRCIASTITHPRGGYLTTRLFVSRDVWQTRNVKLKYVDDKIANMDLLTAALGKLSTVDTYDADAVLEELQSFEEVMERIQSMMIKRLGNEVGVHGVGNLFKDAVTTETTTVSSEGKDAPKTNSGKSYLSSWRKLRSKNSGFSTSGGSFGSGGRVEKEGVTMASIPMTSFVPVDKRSIYRRDTAQETAFEGPLKEYMGSLSRLCEAAQVLDQIARQVEDPGLKHSSPTHIGLELSTRHAAEFFGFYVCRFALSDIGILLDKYVKRSTEWVIA
ncbi:hypothetical protein AAFC00_001105 [Neodothiora populina]